MNQNNIQNQIIKNNLNLLSGNVQLNEIQLDRIPGRGRPLINTGRLGKLLRSFGRGKTFAGRTVIRGTSSTMRGDVFTDFSGPASDLIRLLRGSFPNGIIPPGVRNLIDILETLPAGSVVHNRPDGLTIIEHPSGTYHLLTNEPPYGMDSPINIDGFTPGHDIPPGTTDKLGRPLNVPGLGGIPQILDDAPLPDTIHPMLDPTITPIIPDIDVPVNPRHPHTDDRRIV